MSPDAGTKVILHSEVFDDSEYFTPFKQATRSVEITENFEKIYDISVTYLSPEFQEAFAKRLNRPGAALPRSLKTASSQMGFLVSVFSPEKDRSDLGDPSLWTLYIDIDGVKKTPRAISKLREKSRWEPYFPYVTSWSVEFLVLFDEPLVALTESP